MSDIKQQAWIGLDPGKSGAYALLMDSGTVDVYDWTDAKQFAEDVGRWMELVDIRLAVVEAVHSMPGQGVASSFKFGTVYGIAQGVITAFGIPLFLVSPQKWQKTMLTVADGSTTKEQSMCAARRMFPKADIRLKKHHGRADAILLAEYGRTRINF